MSVITDVLDEMKLEDLIKTKEAVVRDEAVLTEDVVERAIVMLKDLSAVGGKTIACQSLGISKAQLNKIKKALQVKIAELRLDKELEELEVK